jgi:hypothetical protein
MRPGSSAVCGPSRGRPVGRPFRIVVVASCIAFAIGASQAASASPYSTALAGAAARIDHAANTHGAVPQLHVPPAPAEGPPRYSPSVDDWLQGALQAARQDRGRKSRSTRLHEIAVTLRYLDASATAAGGAAGPKNDVGATTSSILAGAAYRSLHTAPAPPPKETIWDRIVRWIAGLFDSLFSGLSKMAQGAPYLGSVFAIVLIALAALALGYVAYRIAEGWAARRRIPGTDGDEAIPAFATGPERYAAALEAAKNGRFARAVALLFDASLWLLHGADRITYDASLTAGEYRRLVRRRAQQASDDFDTLSRAFTLATYADEPIDEAEWMRAEVAYRRFEPALRRT